MTLRLIFSFTALALLVAGPGYSDDSSRDAMNVKDLPEYDQIRDPFWPNGHARKVEPKVDASKPDQSPQQTVIEPKWPKLKLKAITTTPKGHIAIIDQVGLVEEGQVIKRRVDNVVYTWRIDKITEKGFTYTQVDAGPAK